MTYYDSQCCRYGGGKSKESSRYLTFQVEICQKAYLCQTSEQIAAGVPRESSPKGTAYLMPFDRPTIMPLSTFSWYPKNLSQTFFTQTTFSWLSFPLAWHVLRNWRASGTITIILEGVVTVTTLFSSYRQGHSSGFCGAYVVFDDRLKWKNHIDIVINGLWTCANGLSLSLAKVVNGKASIWPQVGVCRWFIKIMCNK